VEPTEFVEEYARRFNEASPHGDFSALAELRTDDAEMVWRAEGQPELRGRAASVAEALPRGATLRFDDVEPLDDGRIRARLSGTGYPPGDVRGTAWFSLENDVMTRLEIQLDEDIDLG
jgi:hypothetical protein